MYKEICEELYNSNIVLLERYKRKMKILEEDLEKKIEESKNQIELLKHRIKMTKLDIEEIELLLKYLEDLPFKKD